MQGANGIANHADQCVKTPNGGQAKSDWSYDRLDGSDHAG
jgi:hypothetical protein